MAFGLKLPKLSDFDPTTKTGIANIATGGLYTPASGALADLDDAISGQDQKDAAREAAARQEAAALQGVKLQERVYDESTSRLDPFYQKGLGTLDQFFNLIDPEKAAQFRADYLGSDEYQQQRADTLGQLEQSAAFGGTLGAGGTLGEVGKVLDRQAFDLSNQALDRELSRLGTGVDIGLSTAGAQTTAGQNFANQASNLYSRAGDAQATSILAGAPTGIAPYLQLAGNAAKIYSATQRTGV
jgi:hypothetical protein